MFGAGTYIDASSMMEWSVGVRGRDDWDWVMLLGHGGRCVVRSDEL